MELPLLGDVSLLNLGIVFTTLIVALLLHLSMNSGSSASQKLDDKAFEDLLLAEDDATSGGGSGGWDDDGEVEVEKKSLQDAKKESESAQKMMNAAKARVAQANEEAAAKAGLGRGMGMVRGGPTDPAGAVAASGGNPTLPTKKQAGPFKIGDRVILQNLSQNTDLNGRHGTIADTWDSEQSQRYPVDLDLYDPRKGGAVSVKASNLKKEGEIKKECDEKRAPVTNGVLSEQHGRAVSFICSTMRSSVANSVQGKPGTTMTPAGPDPKQIAQFCWTFWKTPNGKGVYPSLVNYLTREILMENKLEDLEKQLNPTKPKGAYVLIKDAMKDPLAVASWNCRISGEFWIIGGNDKGTIVVPACNSRAVYCVAGLKLPLAVQIMQQTKVPRPPKFNLTLLPWYGRLVHDPFISTTTSGERIEVASPQKMQELMRAVQIATAENRIIGRLAQLEVDGGSTEGVPFVPFQELNKASAEEAAKAAVQFAPKEQEPATEEELALIDNVSDFEPISMKPSGPSGRPHPLAAWNFIRKGETQEDNPDHDMMIMAGNGSQIAVFQSKELVPTAAEILKKMLGVAAKGASIGEGPEAEAIAKHMVGKRPSIVGVDCRETVERLQFLLQDTKDIRVVGLQVTRRPKGEDGKPIEPKREDAVVE